MTVTETNPTEFEDDELSNLDSKTLKREMVLALRALTVRVEKVEQNTNGLPSFIKSIRDLLNWGSKELSSRFPIRKEEDEKPPNQ